MKKIKEYITIKEFINYSLTEKFYLINDKILISPIPNPNPQPHIEIVYF